mgnify:FL=1
MKIPRILLAAGSSGSGKTLITCGLLEALVERGLKTASFKCGPDYIDPMFHSRVIGTKSRNLDTFFTGSEVTKYLLTRNARDCEIAVMEGVMGFYDGVAGTTTTASAYDLAKVTDTPVILIVNSRGMSVSLAAYVKGFLEYKKDSHIKGQKRYVSHKRLNSAFMMHASTSPFYPLFSALDVNAELQTS